MNKVKKSTIPFILAFPMVACANTVDFLEVNNDVVVFSTTEAKTASPSCVSQAQADNWSVSLSSDSGRAMYSLILTSMAKGSDMGISVETAGDCAVSQGIERAAKITLEPATSSAPGGSTNSGKLGVYSADGNTRLGRFLNVGGIRAWYYFEESTPNIVRQLYNIDTPSVFYFAQADCQGPPYTNNQNGSLFTSPHLEDGRYFKRGPYHSSVNIMSQLNYNTGNCDAYSRTSWYWELEHGEHELCGIKHCILKEE